jgi:hypothetical protein
VDVVDMGAICSRPEAANFDAIRDVIPVVVGIWSGMNEFREEIREVVIKPLREGAGVPLIFVVILGIVVETEVDSNSRRAVPE